MENFRISFAFTFASETALSGPLGPLRSRKFYRCPYSPAG